MNPKMNKNRKEAVALSYDQASMKAPVIVAKGKGVTAEEIIRRAEENHIPVQEDPSLANLLGQLSLNEQIPEELYNAVAEVFAFIYKAEKMMAERENSQLDKKDQ